MEVLNGNVKDFCQVIAVTTDKRDFKLIDAFIAGFDYCWKLALLSIISKMRKERFTKDYFIQEYIIENDYLSFNDLAADFI